MEPKPPLDPNGIDLHLRVKLAANAATPVDVLAYLVRDQDLSVRAALALNPALPTAANMKLAHDGDERVRLLLARKVSAALPGLSDVEGEEVRELTLHLLATLVRDEAVRIRAAIASVAAQLPNIPHDIALMLAQDDEVTVSEPMLRLSPLLSSEDLLALLAEPPHEQPARAIASRPNLTQAVAAAIAASADSEAIQSLLMNQSAAIRESTLDALIARSGNEPTWHAPLVTRPRLPDHAARALAEIVTAQLLKTLAARIDLGAEALASIRERLDLHLAKVTPSPARVCDDSLVEAARQMDARGNLNEDVVLNCLRSGDLRRSCALLAVAAGVSLAAVDRAASLRSAKALVSLVWKAGFSMRAAGPVQSLLGQLSPSAIMTGHEFNFPLSPDEMNWQLDFLGCPTR